MREVIINLVHTHYSLYLNERPVQTGRRDSNLLYSFGARRSAKHEWGRRATVTKPYLVFIRNQSPAETYLDPRFHSVEGK